MELLTQHGYFSIRTHRDDPEIVQVRARSLADCNRLIQLIPHINIEVESNTEFDFPFRINMPRDRFIEALAVMGLNATYTGSSQGVTENLGEKRYRLYKEAWASMLAIEDEPDSGVTVPWHQREQSVETAKKVVRGMATDLDDEGKRIVGAILGDRG
jgi:hypothetical protein